MRFEKDKFSSHFRKDLSVTTKMAESGSAVWRLDKYARYVQHKTGSTAGVWKSYDDCEDNRLVMTLTDTKHLVVLQGSVVLESHSLVTAGAWMRGMSKNDSLLFLYKHGKGTRRFKVKFAHLDRKTGSQVCEDATVKLSALFSIHLTTSTPNTTTTTTTAAASSALGSSQPKSGQVGETETRPQLHGDVCLASMTQIVLGGSTNKLPAAYVTMTSAPGNGAGLTSIPDDVMANHLRLFLADPTFPEFVAKVSARLGDIMKECEE